MTKPKIIKLGGMINFRTETIKALPIPNFWRWYMDNWPGTGFHVWADELLEMEKQ